MHPNDLGICLPGKCVEFPHKRDCACNCHKTSNPVFDTWEEEDEYLCSVLSNTSTSDWCGIHKESLVDRDCSGCVLEE